MNARKSTIVKVSLALTSLAMCCVFAMFATFATSCANSDNNGGSSGGGGTAGGGGAGGGSTGASGSLMAGFTVDDGGYVTAGAWHGWAWPATEGPNLGTTISPQPSDQGGTGFSAVKAGSPLCVQGSVKGMASYGGVGLLGISVQQDKTPANATPGTWAPTGTGVKWQLTNTGGSPLRIQINGQAGYPTQAWCFPITTTASSSSGSITWSQFNSKCWGDSTTVAYDGTTPLKEVIVVVPGLAAADQPFNFCLEGLAPN